MIMNIIMLICMYQVIFIIYYFLRNVGNKNAKYVFGVSDVKGLRESETVEEINKVYKKQQKNILLVFMVLPVFCFLTKYMSIQILIWIIWLYAYIIAAGIPYFKANKKVLEYKKNNYETENEEVVYYELKSFNELRRVHFSQFVLPFVLSFVGALLALLKGLDGFSFSIILIAATTILFYVAAVITDRQKTMVINHNSDINVNYSRAKKNVWKNLWVTCSYINAVLVLVFAISYYFSYKVGMVFIIGAIIECLATMVIAFNSIKKLINIEKQYKDKKEYEYYDNSDKYWKLGMFYFNPNDRHIMVENRTAMGTTVNLATKAGMGLGIFAIVAIIGSLILCIWCVFMEFTPIHTEVRNDVIYCDFMSNKYEIPCDDIEDFECITSLPGMSKMSGSNFDDKRTGTFLVENKRAQVFLNPKNNCFIKLNADDTIYYISGCDDDETLAVFDTLKNRD